jgi:hypothetical protein
LEAERATRGRPRHFDTYERLLSEPDRSIGDLLARLELDTPVPVQEALPRVKSFLTADLRHHRVAAPAGDDDLGELAARAYDAFHRAPEAPAEATAAVFDEVGLAVAARVGRFDPVLVEQLRSVGAARGQYERLFRDAYYSWWWKLAWPLRALERKVSCP